MFSVVSQCIRKQRKSLLSSMKPGKRNFAAQRPFEWKGRLNIHFIVANFGSTCFILACISSIFTKNICWVCCLKTLKDIGLPVRNQRYGILIIELSFRTYCIPVEEKRNVNLSVFLKLTLLRSQRGPAGRNGCCNTGGRWNSGSVLP